MKNLFDFATKELSQDAFIRWLLENFNCVENPKLSEICYRFITELLKVDLGPGRINSIKTWPQWNKIDVLAEIKMENGKNVVLVFEDKTFSHVHSDQLSKYNGIVNNYYRPKKKSEVKWDIFRFLYKTDIKTDNEVDLKECKTEWTPIFIEEIYSFFKNDDFNDTGSELMDFYVKYIRKLYNDETFISEESMEKWNKINFRTYLKQKYIWPHRTKDTKKFFYSYWGWRNIYSSMALVRMYDKKTRLALELVTREHPSKGANIKISTRKIISKTKEDKLNENLRIAFRNYISDHPLYDDDNSTPLIDIVFSSKNEIAKSNDLLNTKLLYSSNVCSFNNTVDKIFSWFEDLCKIELKNILDVYSIKTYVEPKKFNYIIIKVRDDYIHKNEKEHKKKARYETTRSCWRIRNRDIKKYPYVFSVTNGIVYDIYKIDRWLPAVDGRYKFEGDKAKNDPSKGFYREDYIHKRIPDYYMKKGISNPVLYSKGK